jgi:pilus assembly protein CpaB
VNKRFIGVLIFAFVIAASGGLLTYRSLLNRAPSPKAAAPPTAKIVLAAHDVEAGVVLSDDDIKLADWPGSVPAGSFSSVKDIVGRGVITPVYSKEPIIESRLAPKGAGGGLASMIPQGLRAFAVRVNEVAGVAGFVVPGMRVDVVINGTAPGGTSTVARTLLQNVAVLSAGQDFKKDAEGKPIVSQVVTLLVSPEEAEKLSLAASQTTIQLVLRNPVDRQVADTPGAGLPSLFGGGSPKSSEQAVTPPRPRAPAPPRVAESAPPKPDPPFQMEIITGTKKSETSFDNRGEVR